MNWGRAGRWANRDRKTCPWLRTPLLFARARLLDVPVFFCLRESFLNIFPHNYSVCPESGWLGVKVSPVRTPPRADSNPGSAFSVLRLTQFPGILCLGFYAWGFGVLCVWTWHLWCQRIPAHPRDCVQSFVALFDPILGFSLISYHTALKHQNQCFWVLLFRSHTPSPPCPTPVSEQLPPQLPNSAFLPWLLLSSLAYFLLILSASFISFRLSLFSRSPLPSYLWLTAVYAHWAASLFPPKVWQDPCLLGCWEQTASSATGKQKCPWLVNLFSHPNSCGTHPPLLHPWPMGMSVVVFGPVSCYTHSS